MTTTIKCRRRQRCWFSSVLLSLLVTLNHVVNAFLVTSSFRRIGWNLPISWSSSLRTIPTRQAFFVSPFCFSLHAASTSNSAKSPDTDRLIDSSQDPFQVLGIDATADAKVIQRAYKRRALQYHPDVVTTKDSSKEEKKVASDRFAKINWAYMTLTGKGGGGGTGSTNTRASSSSTASTSSSSSSSSSWTPPHRRPASSSSSSSYYSSSSSSSTNNQQPPPQQQPSTDWRDYMPKYEDDEWYDANGDSLGAIFSDIILGVATGGRGLVKDFVEFLEKADGFGVSGYDGSSSSTSFGDLDPLFHSNSISDVGNEMDDTELMVQQLSTKLQNTQNDIIDYQAQLALSNSYVERLQLQEQLAEAQARQKVVQDYLKTARKRLLALQTKYKELLIKQPPPPPPRQSTPTSSASTRSSANTPPPPSSSSSSSSYSTRPSSTGPSTTASTTSTSASSTSGENESWKRESFGSFGRGRSSSSSRARRPSSSTSSRDAPPASSGASSASATTEPPPPSSSSSSYSSARGSASTSSSTSSSTVPPHRRTAANVGSTSWREEQQRLRDLQVEEEFQKLKNQLSAGGGDAGSKSSAPYKPSRQQQVEEEFDKLRKELGM